MNLNGKIVSITGGAGTIGSALTAALLRRGAIVYVISRDEQKHERLYDDLVEMGEDENLEDINFRCCDITDYESIKKALKHTDYLIHAAALKRVSCGEENPFEYHRINVLGTFNVIKACLSTRVQKAILVSSDKAVAPINFYGMTKAICEKAWLSENTIFDTTQFNIVRYGNVLGSNGSIIQRIKKQVSLQEKEFSVCKDSTRFWISRRKAVELIEMALRFSSFKGIFIRPNFACKTKEIVKIILDQYISDYSLTEEFTMENCEKEHEDLLFKNKANAYEKDGIMFIGGNASMSLNTVGFKQVVIENLNSKEWSEKHPLMIGDLEGSLA